MFAGGGEWVLEGMFEYAMVVAFFIVIVIDSDHDSRDRDVDTWDVHLLWS